jgi:serine/threonine protein kinase
VICLDPERLEAFLLGESSPEESTHVEGCERCRTAAAGLTAALENGFGAELRQAAREPAYAATELERAVAPVAALGPHPGDPSWGAGSAATNRTLATAEIPPAACTSTMGDRAGQATPAPERRARPEELSFLAPPQADDEIGRLGDYRVFEVLGQGGMGLVLRAEDVRLGRLVALKVMQPRLAADPVARQRFLREARLMAEVEHERVVPIYQVGEAEGVPFLVMPLLKGQSLDARLRDGPPLSVAEAVRAGREAAEGLAAAHARGLVHRDVKPANLWLRPTAEGGWQLLILDFGLARPEQEAQQLTEPGAVVGTPAYMAPEQAAGQSVDARSDLFSLGCVLYQLLTRRSPFAAPDKIAVLRKLALHDPPPPHQLNAAVPRALSDLVRRLLAKDPADRPATARDVAAALGGIERALPPAEPTEPAPPRDSGPADGAPEPGPPTHPLLTTPPTRGRTRRRLLIAGAAALAGAVLAFGLWRGQDPPRYASAPRDSDKTDAKELTGELVVRVWTEDRSKRGLRIGRTTDDGATPVHEDEQIQMEATLNQPAYVYLLWIDGKGDATPLYPWNDDKIEVESAATPPPPVGKAKEVRNPGRVSKGWAVDDTAGLDTILLLARREPWPPGRSLAALLGKAPKAPLNDPHEVVARGWDKGRAVESAAWDRNRAPKKEAQQIDDQLLQVVDRLKDEFELIRAVRFAHVPKGR